MSIAAIDEQIRLYAKQLKIPTFAEYEQVLRQADPNLGLSELLLELMKAEHETRQANQYRRRLKAAGFPYQKSLDEFDFSQLNETVSPAFLGELASCQFIQSKQNVVMIGNPGRGKTHLSIALGLKAVIRSCSRMRPHSLLSCVKQRIITVWENWSGTWKKWTC